MTPKFMNHWPIEDDTEPLVLREWWHFAAIPHNRGMTCQYFSSNSSNEISGSFCLSSSSMT